MTWLEPGTHVDRYTVLHSLGQGGMATVYAVQHQLLGTRHALKLLLRGGADRLLTEGRLQGRLRHPNVLPVHDVIAIRGQLGLVMPLVRGPSLQEVVDQYQPTEVEAAGLLLAVARAVAHAHDLGIVHRDLKPANTLLEVVAGRVVTRVADFGLARALDDEVEGGERGVVMGTPAYAAPEQLQDAATADHRADLWSLGVMAYRLITGSLPFADPAAAREGRWDPTPVPAGWTDVIGALLQPDPAERLASAAELGDRITALCDIADATAGDGLGLWVVRLTKQEGSSIEVRNATATGATWDDAEIATPHTLPAERDAFVGRAAEVADLTARVAGGARLVTVLGTGGTGKTRLATRLGWSTLDDWPGGVWFVDLAEARAKTALVQAVASALDVPLGQSDPVEQIGLAIAGRGRCLLIFDNFEQIADLAGETVGWWLDAATEAVAVVTSRVVLGLAGEDIVPVEPLGREDAVALFEARASSVDASFAVTDANRDAVFELVDLLDRLPLAVELAAGRIRMMPPGRMVSRMNRRFQLLTRPGRHDRHAALRATLDWSWDLLADWERSALAQCSVFAGGFSLEAAEEVLVLDGYADAPWALDAVQTLVDKSLVRVVDEGRFDLLTSIREYAAEKLVRKGAFRGSGPELDRDVARRHGQFFATLGTAEALGALAVHGGVERRAHLARERDNLVAACTRAVRRRDAGVAAATALAAWEVFQRTGPFQAGIDLLAAAESIAGQPRRGPLACRRGFAARTAGDHVAAREALEEALRVARLAGDLQTEGEALNSLGSITQGFDAAQELHERALAIHREHGHRAHEAATLGAIAIHYAQAGLGDAARRNYEAALAIDRDLGNRHREAVVLGNLGLLDVEEGRPGDAMARYEAALDIHRSEGDTSSIGRVLGYLCRLYGAAGSLEQACAVAREAIAVHREVGARRQLALVSIELGRFATALGRQAEARAALEEALAIQVRRGDLAAQANARTNLGVLCRREGHLEAARTHYEAALDLARRAHSPDHEASALGNLGAVHWEQGHADQARACFEAAVEMWREHGLERRAAVQLGNLGTVHAHEGRAERARACFERALAIYRVSPSPASEVLMHGNLGNLARNAGDTREAEGRYAAALAICAGRPAHPHEVIVRADLARLHLVRGRLDDARATLAAAEEVLRDAPEPAARCRLRCAQALVEHAAGASEDARAALVDAEDAARRLGAGPRSELARAVQAVRATIVGSD